MDTRSLQSLSDDDLLQHLRDILRDGRLIEADLIAHVAEVDARRLYLREACSCMFAYCVERLHLSEPETALRIVVARASRRHPKLLELLRSGHLHLSGIALLAPHLTERNRDLVLARASHLSKRQIEELVAELAPRPDVPTVVRRLPDRSKETIQPPHRPDDVGLGGNEPGSPGTVSCGPAVAAGSALSSPLPPSGLPAPRRGTVEPLAPSRYRVQFTASTELKRKLERLQELVRTTVPDGDLARLIDEAVTEKIARLEARRLAATARPRTSVEQADTRGGPRHVAAAVKRAVRLRDGDQCAYVDSQGRRCSERAFLHFHHRHPHGFGGDRTASNITRFCRAHNELEAGVDFGGSRCDHIRRRSGSQGAPGPTPTTPRLTLRATPRSSG